MTNPQNRPLQGNSWMYPKACNVLNKLFHLITKVNKCVVHGSFTHPYPNLNVKFSSKECVRAIGYNDIQWQCNTWTLPAPEVTDGMRGNCFHKDMRPSEANSDNSSRLLTEEEWWVLTYIRLGIKWLALMAHGSTVVGEESKIDVIRRYVAVNAYLWKHKLHATIS